MVLNAHPSRDSIFVLSTITSQIESRKRHVARIKESLETLVEIDRTHFQRLSKPSIIDCNNIYELPREQLTEKIDDGGKIFFEKLPQNIINQLKRGILLSTVVTQEQKKLVM